MRSCQALLIAIAGAIAVVSPVVGSEGHYKRAVTVADSMYVNPDSGSPPTYRCKTVVINGGIRLGTLDTPSDTAWVDCLLEYNPSIIEIEPLPAPNVNQFFTEHPFFLIPGQVPSGSGVTYDMSIGANTVGFYSWLNAPGDFSLWETRTTTLSVTGNIVWMFRDGVRFDKRVRVVGPSGSSLVIVGGRNGTHTFGGKTYYEAGVWFFGGVESEIPLILVSDGGVYVEQYQDTNAETQALPQISIYAGFAFLTGPETTSGARLRIDYDKPRMDALIDWLSSEGALPGLLAEMRTISIDDISGLEGDMGTTAFDFTVSLPAADAKDVTVDYITISETATPANNDYIATSGTATIPAGNLSTTVTVNVNGDATFEANETFFVSLSSPPANATITDAQGQATIVNDDNVPSVSIGDLTALEGDAGTTLFNFTVTLSNPTALDVKVDYATTDGPAPPPGSVILAATTADNDYVATSGTATIPAKSTSTIITVPVNGDVEVEAFENFLVKLSNSNASIADTTGEAIIENDDGPTAVGNAAITEYGLGLPTPNPSQGNTRIDFAVPLEASILLSVFDVQGREVAVLAGGVHQPGRYQVAWEGRSAGRAVPAGVYFVRYRAPGRDLVRRLAITK